ncbi:MAG: ankyrin repeat domain-containing protein [Nitrospira sp.]|nr:ankyrin repeat domain-containing protein [Nitrospira sp.]
MFLVLIGAWGLDEYSQRYDPYDIDEHLYAGMLLEMQGWTELHIAAARGDEQRVRELLRDSSQLEVKNQRGRTPLYEAAKRGQIGTMKLLIDGGANLEAKARHGFTPLFPAIRRGHLNAVELLVSRGAQVNVRCDCGATALYEAVKSGEEDIARVLLEHGASVNAKVNGQTALGYAEEHRMDDMGEILRQFGGVSFEESKRLFEQGIESFKQEQWDQALALFSEAIASDSENIPAYFSRAATFVKKKKYALALADYRRILQLDPTHLDAHVNISWIYSQNQQWDLGIELWSSLIKVEPRNGQAYYGRALHVWAKQDQQAALDDLKRSCSYGYVGGCNMLKSLGGQSHT